MESIKAKHNAMKEELSALEQREATAKEEIRGKSKTRLDKAETDAASLRRRIQLTQMGLERVEDQTDVKLDKLERLNKCLHETDTCRLQLERKDMKDDNTLQHLESRQRSRKMFVQESEQRHREAFNKLRMLENETAKVDARIKDARARERYCERQLDDAERTTGNLARSGEFKQAKCDEYHERCRRLNDRKERILITAECYERKAMLLENDLVPLRAETTDTQERGLKVKRELRDMLDDLNTYP